VRTAKCEMTEPPRPMDQTSGRWSCKFILTCRVARS